MRRCLGVAVTLMVVMPGIALAQSPDRPVVELGVQGSQRIRDEGRSWSLRLTVPLKRRTAIEATANIQNSYQSRAESARISAREFSAHWRQTVFISKRFRIFGVLGVGRNRVVRNVPEFRGHGQVIPAYTFVSSEFVAHFGPAVQVELTPWLSLRGDLRGTLGERDSGVNVMVGAVIPIRRSGGGDPPRGPASATAIPAAKPKTAGSTLPPADWRGVKPGREVWVTTNTGSLHGEVTAVSDSSLSISEQDREVTIRLDQVRWVEGRDGLRNGFLIGMIPGAVAGGLSAYSAASGICGSCTINESAWILPGAVVGAAVGGLLGAMVDSLIPGRQTLFRGSTTVVTPVITPTGKAINVAIGWR